MMESELSLYFKNDNLIPLFSYSFNHWPFLFLSSDLHSYNNLFVTYFTRNIINQPKLIKLNLTYFYSIMNNTKPFNNTKVSTNKPHARNTQSSIAKS